MATGTIDFDIDGLKADVTSPPQKEVLENTGVTMVRWLFDAATPEYVHVQFVMPGDYASAPVVRAKFGMASATSGNIVLEAMLMAVTPGDSAAIDTGSLDTTNTSGAVAVPGTAGHMKDGTITMTNADSVAAGDWCSLKFGRDADDGTNDTATGDLELYGLTLEYTTT